MRTIQMVDLKNQYLRIKPEIDQAIQHVMDSTAFIKGQDVQAFERELAEYVGAKHCISCGNGTDALQIALMALDLKSGDEVIIPTFTYIATAETAALLGIKIVLVDVYDNTFNIDISRLEQALGPRTKAIMPVHLFGQCAHMEDLMLFAAKNNLYVIEDVAQALGAKYRFKEGPTLKAGNMGTIACTSFFPSKNLGCFGDGGALFTNDDQLAQKIQMIANHGQSQKYIHKIVGMNSRLDTLQAAVLRVKLRQLETYHKARQQAAQYYDDHLDTDKVILPFREVASSHVFHQYTIKVIGNRDQLKDKLNERGIPTMVYYPIPIHGQEAFKHLKYPFGTFPAAEKLCTQVLSLPMHTELDPEQLAYIVRWVNILA